MLYMHKINDVIWMDSINLFNELFVVVPMGFQNSVIKLKRDVEQSVFHSFVVPIRKQHMWDSFKHFVYVSSLEVIIHKVGLHRTVQKDRGLTETRYREHRFWPHLMSEYED